MDASVGEEGTALLTEARSTLRRLRETSAEATFRYSLMGIVGDHFHDETAFNQHLQQLLAQHAPTPSGKKEVKEPSASKKVEGKKTGKHAEQWDVKFNLLLAYKAENGNCHAPKRHPEIGKWIQQQRTNYKKGKMSEDRLRRLEEVGFSWSVQKTVPVDWSTRFAQLVAHRHETGTTHVPARHPDLGPFVQRQRQRHREHTLSDARTAALRDVGFDFGGARGSAPQLLGCARKEEIEERETAVGGTEGVA